MEKQLGRFGLQLEPTKTQVMRFGRFAKRDALRRGERLVVFEFLGFTHYCGTSRSGSVTGHVKTRNLDQGAPRLVHGRAGMARVNG
jgi:hypothetical protein